MTISSNSQTNPFVLPDNLTQIWLSTLANGVTGVATNIGDLMYDGGSGAAYPAGQQASQGSELLDQQLFAKNFIGCALDGILAAETNTTRRLTVKTEGVKLFTCPSQVFKIGDPVGIYSDGVHSPDPTQVDAAQSPAGTIGVVVPYPGNPGYYAAAVTQVAVYFVSRHGGQQLASAQTRTPADQYVSTAEGNGTMAAGQMEGALDCILATSGATALTTRTAAQIYANIPGVQLGMTYRLRVFNTNAGTLTLTGGVGVTITGTATIATAVWRDYLVTIDSATAVTVQNIGAGDAT